MNWRTVEVLYARKPQHPHVIRRVVPAKPERELPPAIASRVDIEVKDLDEAAMLLGAFIQTGGKLRESRLARLRELVGTIPSVDTAKAWKSALKELRAELAG